MPGEDHGIVREGFEPLERIEHLLIVAVLEVGTSAIPNKERITREKVILVRDADPIAAFAQAVPRRMKGLDRKASDLYPIVIGDMMNREESKDLTRKTVLLMEVKVEREAFELVEKTRKTRDMIKVGMREKNSVEGEVVLLEDVEHRSEVFLRIDPGHFSGPPINQQIDEVPVIAELELRDRFAGDEALSFFLREVEWDHHRAQFRRKMEQCHLLLDSLFGSGTGERMSKTSNFPSGFGWAQGSYTRQPHVDIPQGTYEEEHGRNGFSGRASHLYHRHPPTGWLRIEGPHRPHAYDVVKIEGKPEGEAEWFLGNSDVLIGIAKLSKPMNVIVRNADGDEVRFIHFGSGTLQTDYGDVEYRRGDYLVIPRGTNYRFIPREANVQLVIESPTEVGLPDRGMLGRHAQFDPAVMRVPQLPGEERKDGANAQGEFELRIKREGVWTKVFYPWNPMNAVGWKGDLAPWALNVDDIRPIISPRYHLPPSVHTTFLAQNFVICSFLPRPLESEPGAMKVPFYHRNIDFDEVLFYHDGNFFSREGISAGAVTWHPQGIHHGPHPNAEKNAEDKAETKEIAVMVDTKRPLQAFQAANAVEHTEYAMSWRVDQKR